MLCSFTLFIGIILKYIFVAMKTTLGLSVRAPVLESGAMSVTSNRSDLGSPAVIYFFLIYK